MSVLLWRNNASRDDTGLDVLLRAEDELIDDYVKGALSSTSTLVRNVIFFVRSREGSGWRW